MTRMLSKTKIAVFHLVSIVMIWGSLLYGGETHFRYYRWGQDHPALQNTNPDTEFFLKDWQIAIKENQYQPISVPFYAEGLSKVRLKAIFNLDRLEGSGLLFLEGTGLKGIAKIILNGQYIQHHSNHYGPFRIKLPGKRINHQKPNELILELNDPEKTNGGFPQYAKMFSRRQILGITRPLFIRIQPENRVENFIFNAVPLSQNRTAIDYDYIIQIPESALDESLRLKAEYQLKHIKTGAVIYNEEEFIINIKEHVEGRITLDNQYLWSPENPQPLKLTIRLSQRENTLLRETHIIGVRDIELRKNRLYFNNSKLSIKGINYHEPYDSLINRNYYHTVKHDFELMKQFGFNAVRLPQYCPDETMIHLADSLGLLLFGDLPIWRYPKLLYSDDNLLEISKKAISDLSRQFSFSPSFIALGIGREIPVYEAIAQKFMLILKSYTRSHSSFFTYLSPIPHQFLPPEQAADFYIFDHYFPLQEHRQMQDIPLSQLMLAGNLGIIRDRSAYIWDEDMANTNRAAFIKRDIYNALRKYQFEGGFVSSYRDIPMAYKTHVNIEEDVFPGGLVKQNHDPKHWVDKIQTMWSTENMDILPEDDRGHSTNFFSILVFFSTIIFFYFYRTRPRMRDNFNRAVRRPYGFFVDMRERRIIPLVNSFLVSGFAALLLAVYVASYFVYYNNSYGFQEVAASLLIPFNLYHIFLLVNQQAWAVTLLFFILFFLLPILISTFLKLISYFSLEKIRFRQALAIGLWSGVPILFLMPFSLAHHHLLPSGNWHLYLVIILLVVLFWAHIRIINGIRVLFITSSMKVALILFLSYLIPLIILWFAFKPVPYWIDYINMVLEAHTIF
ncbi:MAG: hypothetical protein GF313_08920 [Caldithrix sp.]|nr:hypothetical protein [Caldithrix sp.]